MASGWDQAEKGEPIDVTELLVRCYGDRAFVGELLGIFHDQAKRHLIELRQAVEAGVAAEAAVVAHRMKGSAGNITAKHLSGLCGNLELAAIRGSLEGAAEAVTGIEAELDRCGVFP